MRTLTGVDIIEVERIKDAIIEQGDAFAKRIFTEKEIVYCTKAEKMQYQHFAGRFAAKEAIFKALSVYVDREVIAWKDIEIINETDGRPKVNLQNLYKSGLDGLQSIDVSISHISHYAVASAVATFN